MTRTLLRGGRVYSPGHPRATALGVEDGRVAWVGDDDTAGHYLDDADEVVELAGNLVTPAFVDSHVHLAQTGVAAVSLDLGSVPTLRAALDMLARHARHDGPAVVLGFGWDETRWPEGCPPTREQVDRAVGGRPAYLSRVDEHSAVVSSAFLDALPGLAHLEGYHASGLLTRDAHHEARPAVLRMVPAGTRESAIARALRDAAAAGIGMVHELGAPHLSLEGDFATLDRLHADEVLPETVGYWGELHGVERARELGCAGAAGDLCADGAIGSRTAAMETDYLDAAGPGHLYLDAEQVRDHVVACTRAGLQAGFHCIGDRAVAAVADGFAGAAGVVGAAALVAARHRLEHVEMAGPEQVRTLAAYGVTASMQPMFDHLWGGEQGLYARRLGAARAAPMNAFAAMSDAGVALAFGSDTPVTAFDPWGAVRAAARHRTEPRPLSVARAFEAHSRGGWRAARHDEGGVLAVGAPASLAVWELAEDLHVPIPRAHRPAVPTLPDDGLPDLSGEPPVCVLTLVRGRRAFAREGALE